MHKYESETYGLTRRHFIGAAAAGAAAMALSSCGSRQEHIVRPATAGAEATGINEGATASQTAGRGERWQEAPLLPPPNNWRAGQFVTRVLTEMPHYAGTLDDGPSPYNTESILRAAENYDVKLTFFVVGVMVRAFPEILRRIHDAGHQIGNHSVYHSPYTAMALAQQIAPNQQIIKEVIGIEPTVARAPGLTRGQVYLDTARVAGVYEVHTDWATYDWVDPRISASRVYDEHVRGLKRGGIEINHDGGPRRPTADAYDPMLQYSRDLGVTSVTMDELMGMGLPQPFSGTYPQANRIETHAEDLPYIDVCNFDAYAVLEGILKNLSLNRRQQSNVKAVLADMQTLDVE